jgi:hypothetical protein
MRRILPLKWAMQRSWSVIVVSFRKIGKRAKIFRDFSQITIIPVYLCDGGSDKKWDELNSSDKTKDAIKVVGEYFVSYKGPWMNSAGDLSYVLRLRFNFIISVLSRARSAGEISKTSESGTVSSVKFFDSSHQKIELAISKQRSARYIWLRVSCVVK